MTQHLRQERIQDLISRMYFVLEQANSPFDFNSTPRDLGRTADKNENLLGLFTPTFEQVTSQNLQDHRELLGMFSDRPIRPSLCCSPLPSGSLSATRSSDGSSDGSSKGSSDGSSKEGLLGKFTPAEGLGQAFSREDSPYDLQAAFSARRGELVGPGFTPAHWEKEGYDHPFRWHSPEVNSRKSFERTISILGKRSLRPTQEIIDEFAEVETPPELILTRQFRRVKRRRVI